eukprot:EG_transcript_13175
MRLAPHGIKASSTLRSEVEEIMAEAEKAVHKQSAPSARRRSQFQSSLPALGDNARDEPSRSFSPLTPKADSSRRHSPKSGSFGKRQEMDDPQLAEVAEGYAVGAAFAAKQQIHQKRRRPPSPLGPNGENPPPLYNLTLSHLDIARTKSAGARFSAQPRPDLWFPCGQGLDGPPASKYWDGVAPPRRIPGGVIGTEKYESFAVKAVKASLGPGPMFFPKPFLPKGSASIGRSKGHDLDEFLLAEAAGAESGMLSDMSNIAKALDMLNPRSPVPRIMPPEVGGRVRRKEKFVTPAPTDYNPKLPSAIGSNGVLISTSKLERTVGFAAAPVSQKALQDRNRLKVILRPNEQNPTRAQKWYSVPLPKA